MNHTTKAERERLLAAAREHVALDGDGEIVGGFDAAWRSFQAQHDISDARARRIVSTAARQLRGEMIREPGPPRQMDGGEPVTVYLSASQTRRAAELGGGNVSAGVRHAIDACLF
jgi:hypothetical protein